VVHGEGTEQTALFIPLAARAMQKSVAIRQFVRELIVMMPSAVETVEFPCRFPDLRLDAAIPVIKPFYAKLGHVVILTSLKLPFFNVRAQLSPFIFAKEIPRIKAILSLLQSANQSLSRSSCSNNRMIFLRTGSLMVFTKRCGVSQTMLRLVDRGLRNP
jgi:hypothetical protein